MSYKPARLVFTGLFVLCLVSCSSTGPLKEPEGVKHTQVTRGGKYIGSTEREVVSTESGQAIITRQVFPVRVKDTRQRTVTETKTRFVDHNNKTTGIQFVSSVGSAVTTTTAQIRGAFAEVTRESMSGTNEQRVRLPDRTYFDSGTELFSTWNFVERPEMVFYSLDARAPLVEKHVYTLVDEDDGITLQKLAYAGDSFRSLTRNHYDNQGRLMRSEQPMFGEDLQTADSVVPAVNDFNLIDPVRASSVKSPYRISRDARNGHMRYTFGMRHDLNLALPETGEQRIARVDSAFVLDICDGCGPGLSRSDDYLEAARQPTFWLESDHPRLTRIASKTTDKGLSDEEIMGRLEHWARLQMTEIDFAGHFSAADALSLRRGDCTEGAVVLAALGRAAGIPTKVASGIVYSREQYHGISHSFAPHAWTLAFVDGRWKSFDMSLDSFDSTHIAFNISDGDPGSILAGHKLAGLLTWESMTQVKQRETSNNN